MDIVYEISLNILKFNNLGLYKNNDYDFQQLAMRKIENIVSDDLMEKLYFTANIKGLMEE